MRKRDKAFRRVVALILVILMLINIGAGQFQSLAAGELQMESGTELNTESGQNTETEQKTETELNTETEQNTETQETEAESKDTELEESETKQTEKVTEKEQETETEVEKKRNDKKPLARAEVRKKLNMPKNIEWYYGIDYYMVTQEDGTEYGERVMPDGSRERVEITDHPTFKRMNCTKLKLPISDEAKRFFRYGYVNAVDCSYIIRPDGTVEESGKMLFTQRGGMGDYIGYSHGFHQNVGQETEYVYHSYRLFLKDEQLMLYQTDDNKALHYLGVVDNYKWVYDSRQGFERVYFTAFNEVFGQGAFALEGNMNVFSAIPMTISEEIGRFETFPSSSQLIALAGKDNPWWKNGIRDFPTYDSLSETIKIEEEGGHNSYLEGTYTPEVWAEGKGGYLHSIKTSGGEFGFSLLSPFYVNDLYEEYRTYYNLKYTFSLPEQLKQSAGYQSVVGKKFYTLRYFERSYVSMYTANKWPEYVLLEYHFDTDGTLKVVGRFDKQYYASMKDRFSTILNFDFKVSIPDITTEASLTSASTTHINIKDIVTYEGLEPGVEYVLKATLMDKDKKAVLIDALNRPVPTQEKSFKAEAGGKGQVEVDFSVSYFIQSLKEKVPIVVFQKLYKKSDLETPVVVHEDYNDEKQTVELERPPGEIDTVAEVVSGENAEAGKVKIKDTITLSNLKSGMYYYVYGTLMDKKTGKPFLDAGGNPIQSEEFFVAISSGVDAGTKIVEANFSFDSSLIKDKTTLVVFQEVYFYNDKNKEHLVAAHNELEDKDQTVELEPSVPWITTKASELVDSPEDKVVIEDVVTYGNLNPNEKYAVYGSLRYKDTGRPFRGKNNVPVETGYIEFTADKSGSGSVTTQFTFDRILLKEDTALVCYQYLYKLPNTSMTIAEHEDLNDKDQTVVINKPILGKIIVKKYQTDGDGSMIGGAEFTLYEEDGKTVVAKKTTVDGEELIFDNLFPGKYILKETKAPEGYEEATFEREYVITGGKAGKAGQAEAVQKQSGVSLNGIFKTAFSNLVEKAVKENVDNDGFPDRLYAYSTKEKYGFPTYQVYNEERWLRNYQIKDLKAKDDSGKEYNAFCLSMGMHWPPLEGEALTEGIYKKWEKADEGLERIMLADTGMSDKYDSLVTKQIAIWYYQQLYTNDWTSNNDFLRIFEMIENPDILDQLSFNSAMIGENYYEPEDAKKLLKNKFFPKIRELVEGAANKTLPLPVVPDLRLHGAGVSRWDEIELEGIKYLETYGLFNITCKGEVIDKLHLTVTGINNYQLVDRAGNTYSDISDVPPEKDGIYRIKVRIKESDYYESLELKLQISAKFKRCLNYKYEPEKNYQYLGILINDEVDLSKDLTFSGKTSQTGSVKIKKYKSGDESKTIAGAEFTLYNEDETEVIAVKTSEAGEELIFDKLAQGKYVLKETKAPVGYQNPTWQQSFEIKTGSLSFEYTVHNKELEPEEIIVEVYNTKKPDKKGKVTVEKYQTGDVTKMIGGAEFTLYKADGTTVVGVKTSVAGEKLVFDELVHGKYVLKETKAPPGYKDPTWQTEFEITGQTLEFSYKVTNDLKPEIATTASEVDTSDNSTVTIKDIVTYKNLEPGGEYILYGRLMDKSTGAELPDSNYTYTRFTADATGNGEVEVIFTFDRASLTGKTTIVVFETLYKFNDQNTPIAEHEDINDRKQTVEIKPPGPSIVTKAREISNPSDTTVTIEDTVSCENLEKNIRYLLVGTLMDKATGEPFKDAQGKVIQSKPTTVYENGGGKGTSKVKFTFDRSLLTEKTELVVFEKLYVSIVQQGTLAAVHEDINDEEQTVEIEPPDETEIEVIKKWIDDAGHVLDPDLDIVKSITVELLANGKSLSPPQTLVLTKAGGWRGKFTKLPKTTADGKAIVYSVKETAVTFADGQSFDYEVEIGDPQDTTGGQQITVTNKIQGKIIIHKVDEDGNDLEGVVFTLQEAEVTGDDWKVAEGGYKKTGTTDTEGKLVIDKIPAGNYLLTETKGKEGHQLLAEPVKITIPYAISAGKNGNVSKEVPGIQGEDQNQKKDTYYYQLTYTILNNELFEMPASGGTALLIQLLGIMLLLGGGFTLWLRHRRIRMVKARVRARPNITL